MCSAYCRLRVIVQRIAALIEMLCGCISSGSHHVCGSIGVSVGIGGIGRTSLRGACVRVHVYVIVMCK